MLTEIVIGLSLLSSTIVALTGQVYVAKKVTSIIDSLNHRNFKSKRGR